MRVSIYRLMPRRVPVGFSPNRKSLVKHQPAKSLNPTARRFGNSAYPRPQIDCFSPAAWISPDTRLLGQVAIRQ